MDLVHADSLEDLKREEISRTIRNIINSLYIEFYNSDKKVGYVVRGGHEIIIEIFLEDRNRINLSLVELGEYKGMGLCKPLVLYFLRNLYNMFVELYSEGVQYLVSDVNIVLLAFETEATTEAAYKCYNNAYQTLGFTLERDSPKRFGKGAMGLPYKKNMPEGGWETIDADFEYTSRSGITYNVSVEDILVSS